MDDPAWVGDPEDVDELFLIVDSVRANLKLFPELLLDLRDVPTALVDITVFL